MVLKSTDEEAEKIDFVNGYLQCQFRRSDKVQDYYWTFGDDKKPHLHSVEDLGDECIAANYRKGDVHYDTYSDMDHAYNHVLEVLVQQGWQHKDDYRQQAFNIIQQMCDVVSTLVVDIGLCPAGGHPTTEDAHEDSQGPRQSIIQRIKSRLSKKAKAKKIVFEDCEEDRTVSLAESQSCISVHREVPTIKNRKRSTEDLYNDNVPASDAKRSKSNVSSTVDTLSSTPGCSHWSPQHSHDGSGDASTISPVSSRTASPVSRITELCDYTDGKLENMIAYGTSGNMECEMDIHYSTGFSTAEMIENL